MQNPLLDKDFLYELNQFKHKEIYARIISLNFQEQPIEQIEGKVTGGSINIDGNSAVRRTCNLTLIAKDVNITDFYWGVSNKFTLEIGIRNFINPKYPDIIWFKQGIFVIASFNSSLANNNYSISISGKDKMCLLNGDLGGSLHSSIDFGKIDSYTDSYSRVTIEDYTQYKANQYYIWDMQQGKYILSTNPYQKDVQYYCKDTLLEQDSLKIKDIIREAVHTYGKEMYHNIVINDLDEYGLELLEYRGDTSLYMLYNETASIYDQMIDEKNAKKLMVTPIGGVEKPLSECKKNTGVDDLNSEREIFPLQIGIDNDKNPIYENYSVTEIKYGDVSGYRTTDLVYAGELISSIGESLTSILDKIKNMLGPFEYFYDLEGRFVFQAKKIYANHSWNTLQNSDKNTFARDAIEESPYSYSFEDINLIQKFSNVPAINNIKNDYSIWGVRKSVDGAEIPIHARYAIHEKPTYYKNYEGKIYCSDPSILEDIKAKEKEKITNDIKDRINNFKPQYSTRAGLVPPIKNKDGSWSPGWWDIRDWHEYYTVLKQSTPVYSMKEYSHNNLEGCVAYKDVFLPGSRYYNKRYHDSYVWLVIYETRYDRINVQHGSGNPMEDKGSWCFRYQSEYDENHNVYTYYIDNDGNKKTNTLSAPSQYYNDSSEEARKMIAQNKNIPVEGLTWFIPPYDGCNDKHTYLEFLDGDIETQGNLVYFYNPKFPDADSFDEAVQDQIDKEYEDMIASGKINFVDWREIIYQMAKDYYQHNQESDFYFNIKNNNIKFDKINSYFPTGETGYEIFYTDIQRFWRDLYNPNPDKQYDSSGGYYEDIKQHETDKDGNELETYRIETVWNDFIPKKTFACDYFLKPEKDTYSQKKILSEDQFNLLKTKLYLLNKSTSDYIKINPNTSYDENQEYYMLQEENEEDYSKTLYYWNKNTVNAPELLDFWIDFYTGDENLSQYSISAIGNRPKVVNNTKITSIYGRDIPKVIFVEPVRKGEEFDRKTGYTYIQLNQMFENLFSISSQGKSAEEEMNELINKYSYCSESINLTAIPVYFLEPNTLIYINNSDTGINGKYQVNRITIPLTYNGMMSLSATKIINSIY